MMSGFKHKPMIQFSLLLMLLAALAWLPGCAGVPLSYRPDPTQPAVLELDPGIKGRGCIYIKASPTELEVVLAQDGTSDWSVSRMLGWLGDLGAAVFGGGQTSTDGMQAPDPVQGCAQLFGDDPQD